MAEFGKTIWLAFVCLLSAASTPCLFHVHRFPIDRAAIRELCSFNRSYRINVSSYRNFWPDSEVICQTEKECDLLWKAWDCLDDAKNDLFSVGRRRKALAELLGIIGSDAFLRGEMPPHVPYWRFTEVR